MSEIDFWDVVDTTVSDVSRSELQRRKDERMKQCGLAVYVSELEDGGRKITKWYCKDRRCDKCNKRRGEALKSRIELLVVSGIRVSYLRLPSNMVAKLCKTLGQEKYIRIPQANNQDDIFFVVDDVQDNPTTVTQEFIDTFDWTECATRHGNHITSGKLMTAAEYKEVSSGGPFLFETQDIIAYPGKIVSDCFKRTCSEVIAWHQPDTREQGQQMRNYFNAVFIKNIVASGGKILQIIYLKKRTKSLNINFINLDERDDIEDLH